MNKDELIKHLALTAYIAKAHEWRLDRWKRIGYDAPDEVERSQEIVNLSGCIKEATEAVAIYPEALLKLK